MPSEGSGIIEKSYSQRYVVEFQLKVGESEHHLDLT